ncbi:MAG: hypothetical protein [Chaetfec virus UA24_244]|nr:MAG: hypothetical protein [Chaetfec virus UA24_244]
MTRPIQHLNSAMGILINSLESVSQTMGSSLDTSALEEARNHTAQATAAFDQMEEQIRQTGEAEQQFDRNIQGASSSADALAGKLKGILATVGSIATVKRGFDWMKENMELADVQRNAENQLRTVLANMGVQDVTIPVNTDLQVDTAQTMSAFDAIAQKASEIQGKGIYGDEAMIAGAAELSTYFTDAEAIMSMMDTLSNYAMGMSGGGELDATAMVDYATGIGKIMSGAYDAMTKKGFEFTDAQKTVIEGTATQAQYIEALGADYESLSEDMRAATVINDIVGESWDGLYETMSNTPEGQIVQFNNTLGDLRETLGNQAYPAALNFINAFNEHFPEIESILTMITNALSVILGIITWVIVGVLEAYNAFTTWEGFAVIVDMIQRGILFIMGVMQNLASVAVSVAQAIIENWSWIGPIVYGVAAIVLIYQTYTLLAAAATTIWAGAQMAFNAIMAANPVFLVVAGIVALIAAITAAIRATDTFGAKSTSVLGTICGMVNVVIQFFVNLGLAVANIALGIWNALGACCSNIGIAFHNVIANVQGWFYGLLSTALTVVEGICAALNRLPFVEFDYSGISNMAADYAAKSAEAYGSVEDYKDVGAAFSEGFNTFDAFSTGWAQDAFDSGAAFGDGILDGIGSFLDDFGAGTGMDGLFDFTQPEMGGLEAYNMGNVADNIAGSSADTAGNTAAMADTLDYMEEDLKYMLDIAEREAINRFTTAEITVEQHNENHIEKDTDLDGIMDAWTADFAEKLDISEEGVN